MTNGTDQSPANALQAWIDYITPFATTVSKSVDEVNEVLKSLIGDPGDQAIVLLKDVNLTPDAAIKSAFQGTPLGVMNLAISKLREQAAASITTVQVATDVLPDVPNDESLLASLRAGGVLKVEESTVISAVRTALASRVGLYEIPDILARTMEEFADRNDDPADPEVFKARKDILRRNYAEVFEAIPGMDGSFVTAARRNKLLGRVNEHMWPAMIYFHQQLSGWVDSWQKMGMSPMMMNQLLMRFSGMAGTAAPITAQVPDTGPVRDAALEFNNQVNKVFAGFGVQIAAAMAYEALQIKKSLDNPRLPALVGEPNRDQMLRSLGVNVSANYPRLETSLTKYALSILKVEGMVIGSTEEQQFLVSLAQLGNQIPWGELNLGSTRRVESEPRSRVTRG